MLRAVVLLALLAVATAEKVKFDNYKVFRIAPETTEQLEILKQFEGPNDSVSKFYCLIIN